VGYKTMNDRDGTFPPRRSFFCGNGSSAAISSGEDFIIVVSCFERVRVRQGGRDKAKNKNRPCFFRGGFYHQSSIPS